MRQMMESSDNELIAKILQGNQAAYAVLVDRYKDMAYTLAYRITSQREEAEEVVMDAFVKAFRNLSGFRNESRFSTWFYRIVHNTAISRKRIKAHIVTSMDDMKSVQVHDEPLCEDPAEEEGQDRLVALQQALESLNEEDRYLVTLYYGNNSSVAEIHEITGLSKSNVKIRLFRARKKIQESMALVLEKVNM